MPLTREAEFVAIDLRTYGEDAAAHVIRKLLCAVGPKDIRWLQDRLWPHHPATPGERQR